MKEKDYVITSAGIRMPKIIYGTAWKKDQTSRLVEDALRAGFRGIDTACQPKHYQESLVGEALLHMQHCGIKRKDIFLQTKFTPVAGQDLKNLPYTPADPLREQVLKSFAVSKQNLYTNYIDSLVLHSPYAVFADLMVVWQTMESFVHKKEVGQLGLSNCYDLDVLKELYETATIKPSILQNHFHKKDNYDINIRAWCDEHNIIYQSFWSLTGNPNILLDDIVEDLAIVHNKTTAQIWFAFLRENNIVPLTGTSSQHHMQDDLESLDIYLSKEELDQIATLLEKYR